MSTCLAWGGGGGGRGVGQGAAEINGKYRYSFIIDLESPVIKSKRRGVRESRLGTRGILNYLFDILLASLLL